MKTRTVPGLSFFALLAVTSTQPTLQAGNSFTEIDLVSDVNGRAAQLDSNLVNPWGIAASATSPFWVADNGTGVSTLYNGAGAPLPLVVTVPTQAGGSPPSTPTGVVFNGGSGFELQPGTPARFIFASEQGVISGWNPAANPTAALREVDNSGAGAVYKGLAVGNNGTGDFLYAANFHAGRIDVFDSSFGAAALPGSFIDPSLPAGYAPFNIQNLGGQLYVTYALADVSGQDEVPGAGDGFVDVFDLNGNLVKRLASGGPLNAPWGLALAGPDFGPFSNSLLVGNFGDGRINALDPATGNMLGTLRDPMGNPLQIDGLWGLAFGNGGSAGNPRDLYFTAGIDNEAHGLFGKISAPVPDHGSSTAGLLGMVLLGVMATSRQLRHA